MHNRTLRLVVVVGLPLLLVACGGAAASQGKQARAPEGPTATDGASESAVDMGEPAPAATPGAPARGLDKPTNATHATAKSAAPSGAPAAAAASASSDVAAKAAPAPKGAPAGASAPSGPTTLKGKLGGGTFAPKVAILNDASLGDEVFLTIVDRDVTCAQAELADGDKHVQVRVPWKNGHYESSGKSLGVKLGAMRGKRDLLGDAASASVDVISAPRNEGAVGRVRLHASAPKEKIDGEIDVRVCMDLH